MSDKPPPYQEAYSGQAQGGQYPSAPPPGYPPQQYGQGYPPQQYGQGYPPQQYGQGYPPPSANYPPGEKGGPPPQQHSPYPSQPLYPQGYPQQTGYSQHPPDGKAGQPMLPQGSSGGPTTQTIIIQAPQRPPSYMWLACLVYWCCNWLLGAIAFALSVGSNSAAQEQNYEQARKLGRASMWVSIAGIIFTVVLIVVAVVIVLTADTDHYDTGYK